MGDFGLAISGYLVDLERWPETNNPTSGNVLHSIRAGPLCPSNLASWQHCTGLSVPEMDYEGKEPWPNMTS